MLGGKALEMLAPASGMQIELSRCVHRRFARTQCRACAEVCPSGALRVDRDPSIDPARCTHCRRCETVCPTGALRGDERDHCAHASTLASFPQPVLGCHQPDIQAHARTACLGFLEVEGLLALSLLFPEGLSLNLSRCQHCVNGGMVPELEAAATQAERLAQGSGARVRLVKRAEELQFREIDLSRREFFTFLRKRSADSVSLAANRLQQTQQSFDGRKKNLPSQRRLLLRALPLLPQELRQQVEAELFPDLRFGPTCTGCTGCAGICPTGAIMADKGDPPRPVFLRHFCTNCKLCAEFCRKTGISLL